MEKAANKTDPGEVSRVNAEKTFRYEKKFVIEGRSPKDIAHLISLNPACFSEIYAPRFINNIYFDSNSMNCYFANIKGINNRIKARIRWYGDLFGTIERPVLEFKIRRGNVGTKASYGLSPLNFIKGINTSEISDLFRGLDLSVQHSGRTSELRPSLLNRYRRTYFLSNDGRYRLTLDSDLTYYSIQKFNNLFIKKVYEQDALILELKYEEAGCPSVDIITQFFDFRLSRNSKYINGVNRIDPRFSGHYA